MPNVCFYFQVHQPYRLRHYRYFDVGADHAYFDAAKNAEIMRRVALKCYLPANRLLLRLIERHRGRFRVAFSVSGVAVEQMRAYAPEALQSFVDLARTGCVEFLGETYHHSLAAVYDPGEFAAQARRHAELVEAEFGRRPQVFRNTELIYDDGIGRQVAALGFRGMLAEGADDILGWRSPNFVYRGAGNGLGLLLKNYRLSDDVAFRFSNREWDGWPLSAPKYAAWLHQVSGNGTHVSLFMDYETFGEHQWSPTGIFEFLEHLPDAVFTHPDWGFQTPSEVLAANPPAGELPFPRTVSWADVDRDLTAWRGNKMQESALREVYELREAVLAHNNPATLDTWRRLQTSDHFYYMCTKWFADGDVHAYFNPYESPYDAFINYMNVLTDFRESILGLAPAKVSA